MEAVAYRILKESTKEVLLEGIVRNVEDTIYPSQVAPWLLEEFSDMPFQCELHHFNVTGCKVIAIQFDIPWEKIQGLT